MILELKEMLFDMLANQFVVAHLDKKIKFNVAEASGASSKFKKAVEEAQNKNFLKDADYVIQFAEPIVEGQTDDVQKDDEDADKEEPQNTEKDSEEKEDTAEDTSDDTAEKDSEEDNSEENTSDDTAEDNSTEDNSSEDNEDNADDGNAEDGDDKKKKNKKDDDEEDETLNESKIEDITSSMCTTIKTKVKTGTKPCSCGKKIVQEKEKTAEDKKDKKKKSVKKIPAPVELVKKDDEEEKEIDPIPAGGAEPAGGDAGGAIDEAETEASGDELKLKIQKSVKKAFGIQDSEKIEFFDLPGFADGYNIYFTKVSFKNAKDTAKKPDPSAEKEDEEKSEKK